VKPIERKQFTWLSQAVTFWFVTAENIFDARSARVGFMLEKVALRHVFLSVRQFFPVSIIPSMIRIYLFMQSFIYL
jgi:hypothetical protein